MATSVALATSAGSRPKPSPPVDHNEDRVAVVHGEHGDLLIIADAHHGADAAELAVESVLEAIGPSPPPRLTVDEIVTLIWDAGRAVQRGTSRLTRPRVSSATTLALALVTPECVHWGSFGDSSVFLSSARSGRRLDRPRPAYLGFMFAVPEVAALASTGVADRAGDEVVVLASDGYLDFGVADGEEPGAAVARCVEGAADAATIARRLVETALGRDASDAVSVAVALSRLALPREAVLRELKNLLGA